MRVPINDPVWFRIRIAMYKEARSEHGCNSPSATIQWIVDEFGIEFIRNEEGMWIDTEIPDDTYLMLVLKYS